MLFLYFFDFVLFDQIINSVEDELWVVFEASFEEVGLPIPWNNNISTVLSFFMPSTLRNYEIVSIDFYLVICFMRSIINIQLQPCLVLQVTIRYLLIERSIVNLLLVLKLYYFPVIDANTHICRLQKHSRNILS